MVRVAITGAAGNIAYSLLPLILTRLFSGRSLEFRLLDLESQRPRLEGVGMELEDLASDRLKSLILTSDEEEAFDQADWVLMLGAYPRQEGMERRDLLARNGAIFKRQGALIGAYASSGVQVVVVGNPCNTNAMIAAHAAHTLPPEAFTAMMMLDHNRARSMLAQLIGCQPHDVEGLAIWGNHSSTMVAEAEEIFVHGVPYQIDPNRLYHDWLPAVQERGAAIIAKRGLSSAASAAWALCDHIELLTAQETGVFSVAVHATGVYGTTPGTWVSLPHRKRKGRLCLEERVLSDRLQASFARSVQELAEEREACRALGLLS